MLLTFLDTIKVEPYWNVNLGEELKPVVEEALK